MDDIRIRDGTTVHIREPGLRSTTCLTSIFTISPQTHQIFNNSCTLAWETNTCSFTFMEKYEAMFSSQVQGLENTLNELNEAIASSSGSHGGDGDTATKFTLDTILEAGSTVPEDDLSLPDFCISEDKEEDNEMIIPKRSYKHVKRPSPEKRFSKSRTESEDDTDETATDTCGSSAFDDETNFTLNARTESEESSVFSSSSSTSSVSSSSSVTSCSSAESEVSSNYDDISLCSTKSFENRLP